MSQAEIYRQELTNRKQSILSLLGETEKFFQAYDAESADIFRQLQDNLSAEEFTIVVVGEFSTGKSTFLNALMHRDCLPRKATVTTATVNFLKHIDKATDGHTLLVYYNDPDRAPMPLDINRNSLQEFVTAQSDLDVSKEINKVELYLDSKFLEDNVTLVDSPGLNALAEGHKEITEKQIKKSHACIFLFDKATEAQFNFLHDLQDSIDRVFILRNKIDEMDPHEVEEVLEDLKKSYSKVFPNAPVPKIYGISAQLALDARTKEGLSVEKKVKLIKDSRIEDFEARLWEFLTHGEKTLDIMSDPVKKTVRELENYRHQLEDEKGVLAGVNDTDDLQQEVDCLESEREKLLAQYDQQKQTVLQILQKKHSELNSAVDEVEERIGQRFSREIDDWDGLGDLKEEVRDFEKRLVRDYQRGIEAEIQRMNDGIFQEVVTMVTGNLDAVSQSFAAGSRISFTNLPQTDIQNIIKEHGIEEYQIEKEKREAEIARLYAEEEKASDNIFRTRKLQRQREDVEAEIREINAKIEHFQSADYPLPAIRREQVQVTKTRDRRGFFGKIAQIFMGEKEFVESELHVDDSHYRAALNERNEKIGRHEAELKDLREKLSSLPEDDGQYEIQQKRLARQIRDKQQERDAFVQEFKEKYQKENAQSLKKLKRRLRDHMADVSSEVKNNLSQYLQQERQRQAAVITDQITAATNKLLEKKAQQIAKLQAAMQASDAEKNEKMSAIDQQLAELAPLLRKAFDLDGELDLVRNIG